MVHAARPRAQARWPHAVDLLLLTDLSPRLCGSLSLRDLASLRGSCTAGRQVSGDGWALLTHLARADAAPPAVWPPSSGAPTADQLLEAVDGDGGAMDRAVAWAVSAQASGLLRALSDAARDEHGSTCLHRLLGIRKHLGRVTHHRLTHRLLWDAVRGGANPDARDQHGMAPLHTAALHGHSGAVHVLAAAGADVTCAMSRATRRCTSRPAWATRGPFRCCSRPAWNATCRTRTGAPPSRSREISIAIASSSMPSTGAPRSWRPRRGAHDCVYDSLASCCKMALIYQMMR